MKIKGEGEPLTPLRNKEIKKMMKMRMSTLQKEQMESLYNLYERKYWFCKNEYERTLGAIKALREVAEIFGYRFESYEVKTVSGKTCSLYRLEEI